MDSRQPLTYDLAKKLRPGDTLVALVSDNQHGLTAGETYIVFDTLDWGIQYPRSTAVTILHETDRSKKRNGGIPYSKHTFPHPDMVDRALPWWSAHELFSQAN